MPPKSTRPGPTLISKQPARAAPIAKTPRAKGRTLALTGAVAVITVAGTLLGATLKSKEQVEEKQTVRKRAEVNTADQIALLEATRGQLLSQKMYLEQKIGELQERQRKKKEADRERERMMEIAGRSVER